MQNQTTKNITLRLYAELNDFLPREKSQKEFQINVKTPVTIQEVMESLKIPLAEIDLILVNSKPAEFSQQLHENDYVSVYPVFESFDVSSLLNSTKKPLRETRFILDAHLGKLAKYLRMLGFDTLYKNDFEDDCIIEIAKNENRIILSRDRRLLHSKNISHGYYVRSIEKHDQLREIVNKFDLYSQFKSFTRCMTCNAELIRKPKKQIVHKIDADTARVFNEFYYCPDCEKVFWKGSHFDRMEKMILDLVKINR